MINKLKEWYKLLTADGVNSKKLVREEIKKEIKRLENEASIKTNRRDTRGANGDISN